MNATGRKDTQANPRRAREEIHAETMLNPLALAREQRSPRGDYA